MGTMPMKVSILITAHNYGLYLKRAIKSALSQTMRRKSYEIVVVDDGSTDDTIDILKEFTNDIVLIRQENCGLPQACNKGISASKGEYLIRLDADDELGAKSISVCAAVLDSNPDAGLVYTDRIEIDETNNNQKLIKVSEGNIYNIIGPGVMFRKDALVEIGMYNNLYWEEYDLMIRYLQGHKPYYVRSPLYFYHIHGSNMTQREDLKRAGWQALIEKWGIEELRRWGRCAELEHVYEKSLGLSTLRD
jgi:glycosyltransferase involved in cell wall biosynthesis